MAKNRNQNRPQRDRQDERSHPAGEAQEPQHKGTVAEEHMMPAATRVARKQQKKFGHN
ncbi:MULTISPECIES: hypothetical protein [Streptomycetaceae]|uniref:hypothetical protein n=1 Tax=Streptomycetaceae TaxID=2062 RepID=UPI003009B554